MCERNVGADELRDNGRETERFGFLDGMRGWASLAVLFWHVFISWYPITPEIAQTMKALPISNGVFAVDLFFVISGFALSIAYIKRHNFQLLARIAASRYLRLAIPIFAACLIVHFAMVSGVIPPAESRESPYNRFLVFEPTWGHLLSFSLFDVFFRYSQAHTYIPPLWTMSVELIGSMIVILFLAVLGRTTLIFGLCGLSLLGVLLYQQSYYSLFIAGLLVAKAYASFSFVNNQCKLVLWACLLIGCLSPLLFSRDLSSPLFMLSVILFFCSILWLIKIRQFFQNPLSLFLGRISFPLYLVHAPVLWTFSLWLKALLVPVLTSTTVLNLTVGLITSLVSVLLAIIFSPINSFAIYISRRFGVWLVDAVATACKFLKMNVA